MQQSVLIIPGLNGSGPSHWQSWIEAQLPEASRVKGIDWASPVLSRWAAAVRTSLDELPGNVWIIAHSFGCLAGAVAAQDRPEKVAGALWVTPADPNRFTALGLRESGGTGEAAPSIAEAIPRAQFPFPSLLVASSNDPWLKLMQATWWAERWGSRLFHAGPVGHLNIDSGFGPWPQGLHLLRDLRAAQGVLPLGSFDAPDACGHGTGPAARSVTLRLAAG